MDPTGAHGKIAPSVSRDGLSIKVIDQTALPSLLRILDLSDIAEFEECIRSLRVRGAPAIGVFGAFSLAICISNGMGPDDAYSRLVSTRPTAVDLRNCLDLVLAAFREGGPEAALTEADRIREDIERSCKAIGEHGAALFGEGVRLLTHCNAGALAAPDLGTALSPIFHLHSSGKRPFVWVSETRPLMQGSRLTAWELSIRGISHRVLVDAACAFLMRKGLVDAVIVGADRVCANGDIANKIGTLDKAILAKGFSIPFYVAFPMSTWDPTCPSGEHIPIEVRGPSEIAVCGGERVAPDGSECWNPAFDTVPAELITAYITDRGVLKRPGKLSILPR
ncbi:MAG: S-methyl-5-thioribose-1-phosphate isomerase [Candidatus Thermoplasmatota archaeon]|nr:S-methyl-5-thioribose-1-phosphate isomerase [Candidatus Thermoplasmatota archaeon]